MDKRQLNVEQEISSIPSHVSQEASKGNCNMLNRGWNLCRLSQEEENKLR